MANEMLIYAAAAPFEAARQIAAAPEGHRSRRLHGHGFLATVWAQLPEGWARFPGAEVDDLRSRLAAAVSPLDYRYLNECLEDPTDEHLARWIRGRIDVPGLFKVGVRSTGGEGVDLDPQAHAHVWRRYTLQAAHRLPNVRPGHKCGRMHGHGFAIVLHADRNQDLHDPSLSAERLDESWAPIHAELDHACLNDIAGLDNPTSEMLSAWIWRRLKPQLPQLSWVTVYETANCGAHFDGAHYRIWKETSLDSASRSSRAPGGDVRRRIHGHTYSLRLHLQAPLDQVLGWTVDFGDVSELFQPIFERLDHRPLHDMPGLADTDAASLVRWIRQECRNSLPQIDRVDLFETRGCGAILQWGELGPALPL